MAYKNHAKAPASPSYVDFKPKTELKEEEDVDTLIIYVPGFKKEQLRVQVSNEGILKVSGEKPENAEGTQKLHFVKETMVPQNCDINKIRAKFANGGLSVIMPKKVTPPRPVVEQKHQQHEEVASMPTSQPKSEDTLMTKSENVGHTNQKMEHPSDVNGKMCKAKDELVGVGSSLMTRLKGRKSNVVIGFGVAMIAMVGIGAFVAYKYGSFSSSSSSFMEE